MERKLTPIKDYSEMVYAIESSGAWFIGSFMVEIVDDFKKFQNPTTKKERINRFYQDYSSAGHNEQQVRNKINIAIRIIESGLVHEAMEYVLNTNDKKVGCNESKKNAQFLLDRLYSGESILPTFKK